MSRLLLLCSALLLTSCYMRVGPALDDEPEERERGPHCGDGVVDDGELCDGDCPTWCDDGVACTADTLVGSPASCDSRCEFAPIETPGEADGCCLSGSTTFDDVDCTNVCGGASDWTFADAYTATEPLAADRVSELSLGADGLPHFIVVDGLEAVHVALAPGGTWTTDAIPTDEPAYGPALIQAPDSSWHASFAIGDRAEPHLAGIRSPDGQWRVDTVARTDDRTPAARRSFFVDARGALRLAYAMDELTGPGTPPRRQFYEAIRGQDGAWLSSPLPDGPAPGADNAAVTAPDGTVHIAYSYDTHLNTGLRLATSRDGSGWSFEEVAFRPAAYAPGQSGTHLDLGALSTGELAISFSDTWSGDLRDPARADGIRVATGVPGSWDIEVVDNTVGQAPSALLIDPDDTVRVAFPRDDALVVATRAATGWESETLDEAAARAGALSAAVSPAGARFLLTHDANSTVARIGISCP